MQLTHYTIIQILHDTRNVNTENKYMFTARNFPVKKVLSAVLKLTALIKLVLIVTNVFLGINTE